MEVDNLLEEGRGDRRGDVGVAQRDECTYLERRSPNVMNARIWRGDRPLSR
jgi:hypothetical protein